jgi:hypothetical protein
VIESRSTLSRAMKRNGVSWPFFSDSLSYLPVLKAARGDGAAANVHRHLFVNHAR